MPLTRNSKTVFVNTTPFDRQVNDNVYDRMIKSMEEFVSKIDNKSDGHINYRKNNNINNINSYNYSSSLKKSAEIQGI